MSAVSAPGAIGVAQAVPAPGDVAANLAQHLRLARVAADAGAGVLVFPELSLTGYELERGPELAFSERDARLDPLLELAGVHGLWLVVRLGLGAGVALAAERDGSWQTRTFVDPA